MEIKIMALPTREEAETILKSHVTEEYLLLHSHMVAKGMEGYAIKFGEDKMGNSDLWYITGLLHDIDYQEFPALHPAESVKWFAEWGYPQELIDAVEAHGMYEPRVLAKTQLGKTLIATDEVCGLIYAYSLMRPTGMQGMEAKSVVKKFKDKSFAAKISREEIQYGVDLMGIDLKEHITNLLSFNIY